MSGKLLTIRDAAKMLHVTEKEIIDLSERGVIQAYKVGGVYLRFKKDQIEQVRSQITPNEKLVSIKASTFEGITDFFYRNDFYIFSFLVISVLIYFIVTL